MAGTKPIAVRGQRLAPNPLAGTNARRQPDQQKFLRHQKRKNFGDGSEEIMLCY